MELRNHASGAPTLLHQGEGHMAGSDQRKRPDGPAESKTLCMRGHSMRGNRETPETSSPGKDRADRSGKVCGHKPDMYVSGESHIGIVPKKESNKAGPCRQRRLWREGRWPRGDRSRRPRTGHGAGDFASLRLEPTRTVQGDRDGRPKVRAV